MLPDWMKQDKANVHLTVKDKVTLFFLLTQEIEDLRIKEGESEAREKAQLRVYIVELLELRDKTQP